jgi:hypothetical protein
LAHRMELDSVPKRRNSNEWRNVNRARCGEFESVGDWDNIARLCRMMLEAGHTGVIDIYRNETPVFLGVTIERWASGKALRGEQPEHLRKKK